MKTLTMYEKDGVLHFIPQIGGIDRKIRYDENAPCRMCGEPVTEASMGGTTLCPWCDSGVNRDGTRWVDTGPPHLLSCT